MVALDLTALADDGDTLELEDGRTLRLRFAPDEDASISDFDCYGRVEWVDDRRSWGHPAPRPDGFNGNAEKVSVQQYAGTVWWQPPADVQRGSDTFRELRALVNDLASFGFIGLILEECDRDPDAYGRLVVRGVASLWGIEPMPAREYVAEVVGDLAAELGLGD